MTAYIEIMYDDSMAVTFLAFEILVALVMFGIVCYLKRHIHIELATPIPVVQKREEVELRIHVRNTGAIPAARIALWLAFENEYSAGLGKNQIHVSMAAKSDTVVSYRAQAQYCGKINFYLDKGSDYRPYFSSYARTLGSAYEYDYFPINEIRERATRFQNFDMGTGYTDFVYQKYLSYPAEQLSRLEQECLANP